jgi:hypothetical protein
MGRHSAPDDDEDDELVAVSTAPARGTNADLHLLRDSAALRARCTAAIVVPFALFVAVLLVAGRIDEFLLWVWIPTVIAGVLFGLFLDLAHRKHGSGGGSRTAAPGT